jgi:hypothetical protein
MTVQQLGEAGLTALAHRPSRHASTWFEPGGESGSARRAGRVIVGVAVVAFLVLGLLEAWHDAPTFDEPVYVSSGVVAVLHHDLTLNDEHPPLFKVLAALPVLAVHPVVPADGHWSRNDERIYSARFIRAQIRAGTAHRVIFVARLVPLAEAALVGVLVGLLAAALFGLWPGVLAALLWLLNPLVLGIGHLNGVDLPLALTTVLVALALVRWWRVPDRAPLWVGLAAGLAMSAQSTGVLVAALALGAVLYRTRQGGRDGRMVWRNLAWVVVAGWVVVWVPYVVLNPSAVLHPWVVVPRPYVEGLRFLAGHDTGSAPGFLLGTSWTGINPWFWPASLMVKLSTPVLVLLLAGTAAFVVAVRRNGPARAVWPQALAAVVLPAVVLFAFELPGPRTLGVRYLLPTLALWVVLASPLALMAPRRIAAAAMAVLVALAAVVLGVSYPHSLAYTAPPFQPGYRVATDSNVDWGQDFNLLNAWSRGRHPYVAYFGPRGVGLSQLPGARPLLGTAPASITGWVAASATDLTSAKRQSLSWLRAYCPVGTLGGTILLYRFATPPTSAPGPATPAPLCPGAVSHREA